MPEVSSPGKVAQWIEITGVLEETAVNRMKIEKLIEHTFLDYIADLEDCSNLWFVTKNDEMMNCLTNFLMNFSANCGKILDEIGDFDSLQNFWEQSFPLFSRIHGFL